jgi:hypothetical protein
MVTVYTQNEYLFTYTCPHRVHSDTFVEKGILYRRFGYYWSLSERLFIYLLFL